MNQDEQLPYVSSAPDFDLVEDNKVNPQDQVDLSALEAVFKLLESRRVFYDSNSAITIGVDLTIENQMIIHHQMILHIQELESLITTRINKVKENFDGRR